MLADALISSGVAWTVRTGTVGVVVIAAKGTCGTSKGQEMKEKEKGREMAAWVALLLLFYYQYKVLIYLAPTSPESS